MEKNVYMKIKELSQLSLVPPSTIRFYVKEGLLPEPVKTGKTMGYYSSDHLNRIEYIKKMQVEKNASIEEIKESVKKAFSSSEENPSQPAQILSSRKDDIIKAAIELFRKNGFSNTSITDIVKASKVGRDTFYINFSNKEELFLESAEWVFYELYSDVWEEIKSEKDMKSRFLKRWEAFFKTYPKWIDMMNLLRGISVRGDSLFTEKLEKLMNQIIRPSIVDVQKAKEQGYISKNLNSKVIGYMIMGMAEYCANLVYQKSESVETVNAVLIELFDRLK